eukprot:41711-Eustigmatos_ZCMA.PRE.1
MARTVRLRQVQKTPVRVLTIRVIHRWDKIIGLGSHHNDVKLPWERVQHAWHAPQLIFITSGVRALPKHPSQKPYNHGLILHGLDLLQCQ